MVLVVSSTKADAVIAALRDAGESPFRMGEIEASSPEDQASLRYYGNAP